MKKIELSDTVTEEEYSLLIQKLLKAKEELDFVEEESGEEKRREDFLTNWNITVNQEDFEKRSKEAIEEKAKTICNVFTALTVVVALVVFFVFEFLAKSMNGLFFWIIVAAAAILIWIFRLEGGAVFVIFERGKKKYKDGLQIAKQKDLEEEARRRQEEEKDYLRYLEKRKELLPKAEKIRENWTYYEEFYHEWNGRLELAKLLYWRAVDKYCSTDTFISCYSHRGTGHYRCKTIKDHLDEVENELREKHQAMQRAAENCSNLVNECQDILNDLLK